MVVKQKIPKEAWSGRRPRVGHLSVTRTGPEPVKPAGLTGHRQNRFKPAIQTALDRFCTEPVFFLKPVGSVQPPYGRKSKGICKFKKKKKKGHAIEGSRNV
jgi:hypothetical protein